MTRLTRVTRNREEVKERLARRIEGDELTARTASRGSHFCDMSGAADRRHAVTCAAAGAVVGRTKSFVRGLDFEEVVESKPKLFELDRRHAWQVDRRAAPPGVCATSRPRHEEK